MPKGVYDREPLAERFWRQVDRSGGSSACWPWTGSRFHAGHGKVSIGHKNRPAHRIAFLLTFGREPDGMGRHTCDNPPCCNPTHIVEGTHANNMADMRERGRASRHGGSALGDHNGSRTHPERRPRGTGHGRSKLTDDDVRQMRRLWDGGRFTSYQLAAAFGVSQALAYTVATRRARRHVDG